MRSSRSITFLVILLLASFPAMAGDTPHMTWLKAKCALCHGEDGSGNTPEGHSRAVPDLRSEAIQKLTDDELAKLITAGHSRMPSFKLALTREQVSLLVTYIRSLAKK